MRQHIEKSIQHAINTLKSTGILPEEIAPKIQIERTRNPKHGDFACNIALTLAKAAKTPPQQLAQNIIEHLPTSDKISRVQIAGPGFINFTITHDSLQQTITKVLTHAENYGRNNQGKGQRVHIEYVCANPTGPLHVGHGRSAAYGACVANLLAITGYDVHREYYVNDVGRQMRILTVSIWLRYLQAFNHEITLPENAYQGQYIIDIANDLKQQCGDRFNIDAKTLATLYPQNIDPKKDKEPYIDALTANTITLIGEDHFIIIRQTGLASILSDIQDDLSEFGVVYDEWFKESRLIEQDLINKGIGWLKQQGHIYEKEGATWFRATQFGDEKDRVLIRENGQTTYFASDVAYHLYKYNQGYDHIIDVFGSDHHGYIARIRAFLKGLSKNPEKLKILLVQFAILYRGKEKLAMSTRRGSFVTLRELRNEVGNDAARYFYIMRRPEQHLDFDLELAKKQSNENPVYYIQYANARICSVFRELEKSQLNWDPKEGLEHLELLITSHEKNLISSLARYPEIVSQAAEHYEPHVLAFFLQEFANHFHTYYNASKFLVAEGPLRNARLCLVKAAQHVLANGLKLLGISAPQTM